MAHFITEAILWIAIGLYAYWTYKADKARREYERKAQRAVEVAEGWRDAYLKEHQMNNSKEDDHA